MADRTCLILGGLVVERRCTRRREIHRGRVALQAKRVHVAHVQQARIRGAVRRVATDAAFCLEHWMLINERSSRLHVALGANGILVSGGPELNALERTMGIMAVGALHQTFRDLVMEGLGESHLYVGMAVFAELRLRNFEQVSLTLELVNAVATDAAYAGPGVR